MRTPAEEPGQGQVVPELPCNCIVYRAVRTKGWIDPDTGDLLTLAFVRRPEGDEDGLSVNIADHCSVEDCMKGLKKCHGIVSLHVGRLRDIGLNVRPDSIDHACITGVPFTSEDRDRAEKLATLLVERSRFVWRP
jgi:hypothetical protein